LTARNSGGKSPARSFRRRFPLPCRKLVIELDGKQHEWFSDYDAGRSEVLERLGVHVVRFTNEEVCVDLDSVLARIRQELRLPFD